MDPAKPPLPTCRYLPFHVGSVGIHTSKPMLESAVGCDAPATRQKAGSPVWGAPVGGVKVPAGTDCATVIAVWGKARPSRLSHVAAATRATANVAGASTVRSSAIRRRMTRDRAV